MKAHRAATLFVLPLAAHAADYHEATWGDSHAGRVVRLDPGPNTVSGVFHITLDARADPADTSDGFRFIVPEGHQAVITAEWSYTGVGEGEYSSWGWELHRSVTGAPCDPGEDPDDVFAFVGQAACLPRDSMWWAEPNLGGLEIFASDSNGFPRSIVPFLGRALPAGP